MEISHKIDNECCLVSLNGNIALDGVIDVKSYVKSFLEDESIKALVMNLEKVEFMDSSGIGLIVSIFKTLQKRQAKFAICQLNQMNLEILKITHFDKILNIYETEAEAISKAR